VKPETEQFIAYARKLLADASRMIGAGLEDHAARTAYLACFHMARAYTFERSGRLAKTHGGVQTEFFRLSKDDARSDPELRTFLTTAYHYKSSSDYETGPEDTPTPEDAREAVETARRFVAEFVLLTPLPSPEP
jgi:uncharacterized protein (UPF0332 family)